MEERTFDLIEGVKIEMVKIEPGFFKMGSRYLDDGNYESPVHTVEISKNFWIGKFVITNLQWKMVMGSYPWEPTPRAYGRENCPAVNITKKDALLFIQHTNSNSTNKFRLPTEAEWEYSCRAGSETPWCFGGKDGGDLKEYAWYGYSNKIIRAQTVGLLKPNDWGLYDMHGNVFEWVSDLFAYYSGSEAKDPVGPDCGNYLIARGGYFFGDATLTRSAYRGIFSKTTKNNGIGFRIVRDVDFDLCCLV